MDAADPATARRGRPVRQRPTRAVRRDRLLHRRGGPAVRLLRPATRRGAASQQSLFTQRLRTLAALDEAVAGIVAALEAAWRWRGVRTKRYTLVRWRRPRFVELYDRTSDPAQLTNVALDPAYRRVRRALADHLDTLEDCAGPACRTLVPDLPEPATAAR